MSSIATDQPETLKIGAAVQVDFADWGTGEKDLSFPSLGLPDSARDGVALSVTLLRSCALALLRSRAEPAATPTPAGRF